MATPQTTNGAVQTPLAKAQAAMAERRSKQVDIEGHKLDPIPAKRWRDLKESEKKGTITGLMVRPNLSLLVHGADGKKKTLTAKYHPLFTYLKDGTLVVEDVPHKAKSKDGHLRHHWELQSGNQVKDVT